MSIKLLGNRVGKKENYVGVVKVELSNKGINIGEYSESIFWFAGIISHNIISKLLCTMLKNATNAVPVT